MSAAFRPRRFAEDGHTVVGVDVNADKVASLNEGRSPIVEKGLDELIRDNAANGRLRATTNTADAVARTELSLICVGTPSRKNGSLDLTYLERVAEQIGEALKDKDDYHVVVVRSTVLPGTTHDVVIPALERTSGKKYGTGFGVHGQSRVPARRHRDPRLPPPAADARRPQLRLRRGADQGALREGRGADGDDDHPHRGDDEVREQHLARAEGHLRERDRQRLQARSGSTATR